LTAGPIRFELTVAKIMRSHERPFAITVTLPERLQVAESAHPTAVSRKARIAPTAPYTICCTQ
jgi:hypothetical protein